MKEFLKYTFATVCGLILTGVVFTILGIISLAGMVASTSGTETIVKDRSVFVLELKGSVMERYQENPIMQFLGEDYATYGLDDILTSIRKAKENDKIKGIYIDAGAFACQTASMQAIRRALVDFKESGKFIVAYAGAYSQGTYYIASVADKVIANPSGSIGWHGLSAQTMFLKGLLDKVGVEMQVFRVGTYKSAVEPYIATEMSPANREQTQAFIGSIWQQILNEISESRKISVDSLNALASRNMDLQPAELYLSTGLADTLMYKDEVLAYLKQLTDCKEDEKLNTLSLEDMVNVKRNVPKDKSGNVIAVYYAYGEIDGDESADGEGINSEKVIKDLRKLREDESVKAVVLRVNSPGGSAYGSEQIWREVSLLKQEKPVIVSMGDYAASGGYYISCGADRIYAQPTTLTGSIGIFGMIPDIQPLLSQKLGVNYTVVRSCPDGEVPGILQPMSPGLRSAMQGYVERGYELFTRRCAEGRGVSQDSIKAIAEGRVWDGAEALKIGLVDELGGLDAAIAGMAKELNVETWTIKEYPSVEVKWYDAILEAGADLKASVVREELGDMAPLYDDINRVKSMSVLQTRMEMSRLTF